MARIHAVGDGKSVCIAETFDAAVYALSGNRRDAWRVWNDNYSATVIAESFDHAGRLFNAALQSEGKGRAGAAYSAQRIDAPRNP